MGIVCCTAYPTLSEESLFAIRATQSQDPLHRSPWEQRGLSRMANVRWHSILQAQNVLITSCCCSLDVVGIWVEAASSGPASASSSSDTMSIRLSALAGTCCNHAAKKASAQSCHQTRESMMLVCLGPGTNARFGSPGEKMPVAVCLLLTWGRLCAGASPSCSPLMRVSWYHVSVWIGFWGKRRKGAGGRRADAQTATTHVLTPKAWTH